MQYNFCNVTISMGNYVMSQSVWGILLCHNQNGEFCYVTISMGNSVMSQSAWGIPCLITSHGGIYIRQEQLN